MSTLIIAAALAQVGTATASNPPPSTQAAVPQARAGETTYIDLEGGAGYSSNPQLSIFNNEGSIFGRISLHAVHARYTARTTTLLSAYADNVSYTNHQGSQQSVSLSGREEVSTNEHTRLFGDFGVSYTENGQLDTRVLSIPIIPPATPGGPIVPPILVSPTGDFLSVTGHELSLNADLGGAFSLSPVDTLSLTSGVEHVQFHSEFTRTNFTSVPVSLAYDRHLSARTTVGARIAARETDYNGPTSFRVITPQITGQVLLAEHISLDAALGASFARVDSGVAVRHTTGVSAQASLCGQGETNYFCARFFTDEQTATTAGPARSIGGGADYSQRIDANQSIAFSIGIDHYSTPAAAVTSRAFTSSTYYHAAATYSRRIGDRLFGGLNLAARKLTQSGPDPDTDLNVSLFIRYRLGDKQ